MNTSANLYTKQKQSLQLSLKLWLPLLQSSTSELDTIFKEHSSKNPFLDVKSKNKKHSYNISLQSSFSSSDDSYIQNIQDDSSSLYETLLDQIEPPLFPTPRSQKIAKAIVRFINEDGYFEGDIKQIALKHNTTDDFVENIRQRFCYLEPSGVGAVDLEESLLFQLGEIETSEEVHNFTTKMIKNLSKMDRFHTHHHFEEAKNIIKKLKNPPAIDFQEENPAIIPDFYIEVGDDINIKINNDYYPDVTIKDPFDNKNDQLRQKLKEARNLVNLLELRKSTLYKLVLVIVEKQIRFFIGSELRPLTMAEVASELGFEESTISRAVSNKYIECDKGIFSLKSFFTNAVAKNLSSSEIKGYIQQLIDNEAHDNPLTDEDIVLIIQKRYNLQMVRRTITKYRKLLDIPSSKERKKHYKISS